MIITLPFCHLIRYCLPIIRLVQSLLNDIAVLSEKNMVSKHADEGLSILKSCPVFHSRIQAQSHNHSNYSS